MASLNGENWGFGAFSGSLPGERVTLALNGSQELEVRRIQIESWASTVIAAVEAGQNSEDSRVELKAELPKDPRKAARLIAGHANAALDESLLWLIGVDEKSRGARACVVIRLHHRG